MTPEEKQRLQEQIRGVLGHPSLVTKGMVQLAERTHALLADNERLEAELASWKATAEQLHEELYEMRTQFLSDGPFVGWRERQKDAVDEALAAYKAQKKQP